MLTAVEPSLEWGWSEILANKTNYLLEILAWQKSKDGQKNRNQPKPFVPDFFVKEEKSDTEVMDIDELKEVLARPRV